MTSDNQSKHLIVGTAGHVDHGKTTLIRAITGINTDRLKEEQERGLTIDLGFASLQLPSGRQVGIVDVPGHEKFLKNMLAGASGVDIAVLVVAADEGVMPQTREHLEILELLETQHGMVALTKCDMVDAEWIDVVEEDLRETLSDTFLKDANIIRVSGVTGEGVDKIVAELDRLSQIVEQRSTIGPFRLPIDRVFTITGFGTVVTGTLVSGTMKIGDPVRVLPEKIDTRIRQIQIHGKKQETAFAGSRVAVNLAGVEVSDLQRGSVVVPPGYLQASNTIDASVRVLKESPRPLKNRTRIRLHIGTAEAIGRTVILGADEIAPGESGLVQLRLEDCVVAARGDRFVLRFFSPTNLLGGGIVLEPAITKHKRNDRGAIERLMRRAKGDPADIIEDALSQAPAGLQKKDISAKTGLADQAIDAAITELLSNERVIEYSNRYFNLGTYASIEARIRSVLESYHRINAIRPGIPKEELRAQIGSQMDTKGYQIILSLMASRNVINVSETTVKLPDHTPTLTPQQEKTAEIIENDFKQSGANPPLIADVELKYGKGSREIISLLLERGSLVKVSVDLLIHKDVLKDAENALIKYLEENGQITVAQFRDLIGSSRKYVVPLFEYFDSKRVTRRKGDQRILF